MYFFLWVIETILFAFVFTYRIIFASRIFDFRTSSSDPLDTCSLFNEHLLKELILHTIFVSIAIIIPYRSVTLFLLNIFLVLRGWLLYYKKKLFFSPFQLVRDAKKRQKYCVLYIIIFSINSLILIYKLLIVSILS